MLNKFERCCAFFGIVTRCLLACLAGSDTADPNCLVDNPGTVFRAPTEYSSDLSGPSFCSLPVPISPSHTFPALPQAPAPNAILLENYGVPPYFSPPPHHFSLPPALPQVQSPEQTVVGSYLCPQKSFEEMGPHEEAINNPLVHPRLSHADHSAKRKNDVST